MILTRGMRLPVAVPLRIGELDAKSSLRSHVTLLHHYAITHCNVLSIQYSAALNCTVLYRTALYHTVLFSTGNETHLRAQMGRKKLLLGAWHCREGARG